MDPNFAMAYARRLYGVSGVAVPKWQRTQLLTRVSRRSAARTQDSATNIC